MSDATTTPYALRKVLPQPALFEADDIPRGDAAAAIAELNAIDEDPEAAHGMADQTLLAYVPKEVADAYERVVERTGAWHFT